MKRTAYLWLMLLTFAMVACGGAKGKLVGTWKVESMGGKVPPMEMTIEFKKDGSFLQSAKDKGGKIVSRAGKWTLASDNKALTMTPEKGKADNVEIVSVDGKALIFKDDRNEFRLSKK